MKKKAYAVTTQDRASVVTTEQRLAASAPVEKVVCFTTAPRLSLLQPKAATRIKQPWP